MDYLIKQDKEIVVNAAIIREEERGTASELTQTKLTSMGEPVRSRLLELSVLEVIT